MVKTVVTEVLSELADPTCVLQLLAGTTHRGLSLRNMLVRTAELLEGLRRRQV